MDVQNLNKLAKQVEEDEEEDDDDDDGVVFFVFCV